MLGMPARRVLNWMAAALTAAVACGMLADSSAAVAGVGAAASRPVASPSNQASRRRVVAQTAGPAWNCSAFGYLFQSPTVGTHEIMQVDLASGAATRLASTRDNLNAAGYNTLDNYVYAWDTTTSTIVQVASDGTTLPIGDPTRTGADFNIGDFDDAGHLFLTVQGATATEPWYEVDLSPGSATYGKVIASGTWTMPAGLASGADWSWVRGALYMLSLPSQGPKTPHLVRFTASTSASVDLGALPFTVPGTFTGPLLNVFGATYADQAGNLYASYNGGGQIYRIPLSDIGAASLLTVGPASSYNDGARCLRGPSPIAATARGQVVSSAHLILFVMIALLAMLLMALLFFLARRRRRQAAQLRTDRTQR